MNLDKYKDDSQDSARVPTQARLDIRHLAAFTEYLEANGVKPRTRSHLIHSIIGLFHDILVEQGLLDPIPDVSTSYRILEERGMKWGDKTAGHAALVKSLQEEDRLIESLSTITATPSGLREMESEIERILASRKASDSGNS